MKYVLLLCVGQVYVYENFKFKYKWVEVYENGKYNFRLMFFCFVECELCCVDSLYVSLKFLN